MTVSANEYYSQCVWGIAALSSAGAIERSRDEKPSDPAYFDFSMLRNSAQRANEGGQGDQVRNTMTEPDKRPVTMEELLASRLAMGRCKGQEPI